MKNRIRKIWKALRLYLLICGIGINVFVLWMGAGWPVFIDRWLDVSEQPLKAMAIVCLGEGVTGDSLPSSQGWRGIHTALELYHDGWAEKVVFSGGGGDSISEGELYAEAAEWLGLPRPAVLIDPFPHSTAEHPQTLLKINGLTKETPLIIVASSNHSRRAFLCFKNAGFSNFRMVTHYQSKNRDPDVMRTLKTSQFKDFKPSSKKYNDFMMRLKTRSYHFLDAVREIMAISWYRIKGYL
ncbi:MAG: YdcF family protein [Candidatus Aminicenantaceae bacterium]